MTDVPTLTWITETRPDSGAASVAYHDGRRVAFVSDRGPAYEPSAHASDAKRCRWKVWPTGAAGEVATLALGASDVMAEWARLHEAETGEPQPPVV